MTDPGCNPVDEDWQLLASLLPPQWRQQAFLCRAVERLRGFASVDALLRTLLLHVGKGYGLREAAVRAKASGLAAVSDVAILKRLRHAEEWWRWMCRRLAEENGWQMPAETRGWNVRAVDGTLVKEPGRKGRLWRIHYSLQIPSLRCDQLELTPARKKGGGESLGRYRATARDLLLADRAYATPAGVAAVDEQGAAVLVRLNTMSLPLYTRDGRRFPLLESVREVEKPLEVKAWPVWVRGKEKKIAGRLCVLRKSEEEAERARRKIRKSAQRGGPKTRPETLEYAGYVMIFTTLPEEFRAEEVGEWYRARWQIELVFKRMKSLWGLGFLPKETEESARAWLYGKLLLALLCQKLVKTGRDISPWGYTLPESWQWQRVAGL